MILGTFKWNPGPEGDAGWTIGRNWWLCGQDIEHLFNHAPDDGPFSFDIKEEPTPGYQQMEFFHLEGSDEEFPGIGYKAIGKELRYPNQTPRLSEDSYSTSGDFLALFDVPITLWVKLIPSKN